MILLAAIHPFFTAVLYTFHGIVFNCLIHSAHPGLGVLQSEFTAAETYFFLEINHCIFPESFFIDGLFDRRDVEDADVFVCKAESNSAFSASLR